MDIRKNVPSSTPESNSLNSFIEAFISPHLRTTAIVMSEGKIKVKVPNDSHAVFTEAQYRQFTLLLNESIADLNKAIENKTLSSRTSFNILYYILMDRMSKAKHSNNTYNPPIVIFIEGILNQICNVIKETKPYEQEKINSRHPLFHDIIDACHALSKYTGTHNDAYNKINEQNRFCTISAPQYLEIKKYCIIQTLKFQLLECMSHLCLDNEKNTSFLVEAITDLCSQAIKDWKSVHQECQSSDMDPEIFDLISSTISNIKNLSEKTKQYDDSKQVMMKSECVNTVQNRNKFIGTILAIIFNTSFWEKQGIEINLGFYQSTKTPNGISAIHQSFKEITGIKNYDSKTELNLSDEQITAFLIELHVTCSNKSKEPSSSQTERTKEFYLAVTKLDEKVLNNFFSPTIAQINTTITKPSKNISPAEFIENEFNIVKDLWNQKNQSSTKNDGPSSTEYHALIEIKNSITNHSQILNKPISPKLSFQILFFDLIREIIEIKYPNLHECEYKNLMPFLIEIVNKIDEQIQLCPTTRGINTSKHPLFNLLNAADDKLSSYLNKNIDNFLVIKHNLKSSSIDADQYLPVMKYCSIRILQCKLVEIKSRLFSNDQTTCVAYLTVIKEFCNQTIKELNDAVKNANLFSSPMIAYSAGDSMKITERIQQYARDGVLKIIVEEYDAGKARMLTLLKTPDDRKEFMISILNIVFHLTFWQKQGVGVNLLLWQGTKTPDGIVDICDSFKALSGSKNYLPGQELNLNDDQVVQFLMELNLTCKQRIRIRSDNQQDITKTFYENASSFNLSQLDIIHQYMSENTDIDTHKMVQQTTLQPDL